LAPHLCVQAVGKNERGDETSTEGATFGVARHLECVDDGRRSRGGKGEDEQGEAEQSERQGVDSGRRRVGS
jgi:hypothetical protein